MKLLAKLGEAPLIGIFLALAFLSPAHLIAEDKVAVNSNCELRIGVILSLTGPRADAGTYVRNGISLMGGELGENSGEGQSKRHCKVKFIFEDSHYGNRSQGINIS